ncbi:MAG: tRNA threonylcarbamoyladenosine biosynthesis protein TsaE [Kosmotogales bacterium]|nr:tRNA threonylcarbamoyladenosine biosynthesis protein TsaE [Kosmotogales bacterium]
MERSYKKIIRLENVNEEKLISVSKNIAKNLKGGEKLLLFGELGTGKTTFVKGLAEAMKIDRDIVRSPTFTLVNVYPGEKMTLVHADLYRLESLDEIYELDFFEEGRSDCIYAIEWPELLIEEFKENVIIIELKYCDEFNRNITIKYI